jgi:hypothetical protein
MYLETKICRDTRPIWRGKPTKLPDLFGDENLQLLDLFGDENMQSYQTYLERKICRAIRPIWRGNPAELFSSPNRSDSSADFRLQISLVALQAFFSK